MNQSSTSKASFEMAVDRYAQLGVNVYDAVETLEQVALSLHCWQGDDVGGFEGDGSELSGGIQVTGNYPGKARNLDELRQDLEKALSLIPGKHRVNLHAMYGDFGGKKIDRDAVEPKHFDSWIQWGKTHVAGIDFNATLFSHPLADSGYTLCHFDEGVRRFWIEHVRRCRTIAAYLGKEMGSPSVHNLWIPDGSKDMTVTRFARREKLFDSLTEIYRTFQPAELVKDAVESKLFGIGSESYVAGSFEFYLGFAQANNLMLCLDMGHFHPTESVGDKVSALLLFLDQLLVHVSRGVRWDSDHVVIWDDALQFLMQEIARAKALRRINFALDYFDASINRVGAWVIGARATLKALLAALLEPTDALQELEEAGDNFGRLAMLEDIKTLPFGAVWEYYCEKLGTPPDREWFDNIYAYENEVLQKRA